MLIVSDDTDWVRANINPYRLGFWILAYLLFDSVLLSAVKREVAPAFHTDQLDVDYLMNKCPLLEATYYECLRLCNTSLSARRVSASTTLNSKVLQSGSTVVIPFRELHYDTQVFGPDAAVFNPQRFLDNKNLVESKSFRPFGGGVSYCPGRYFARQEMFVFVAIVLGRLDISLSSGLNQLFPEYDSLTPAIGVNGPKGNMDLLIDLKDSDRLYK